MQLLAACVANLPPDPVGGTWLVEDIAGHGVIDRSRSTISFSDEGRVYGSSGCNQFSGAAEIRGRTLDFGPLSTTRRACAEALMDQEHRVLAALDAVERYRVQGTSLVLADASGSVVLRLSRLN